MIVHPLLVWLGFMILVSALLFYSRGFLTAVLLLVIVALVLRHGILMTGSLATISGGLWR